ncbi:MAG: hypothetical protein QXS12_04315 [Candidatus Caldarchaeum sp.]
MEPPAEELPDFLKIPKPLQEKFFSAVNEEVNHLLSRIDDLSGLAEEVRAEGGAGIRAFKVDDAWRMLDVGVVDGADVSAVDDRLGLRCGLYAVAY